MWKQLEKVIDYCSHNTHLPPRKKNWSKMNKFMLWSIVVIMNCKNYTIHTFC